MAGKKFTFEGAVSEEAPFIKHTAFEELPEGCILHGDIVYVYIYKGYIKAAVLINGSTTSVTLWDTTLNEAKELVGSSIKLKFASMNEEGYPDLYVRW